MSAAARTLRVLTLFDSASPVVTGEAAMKRLKVSRATAYRDLATLEAAGFVARAAGRGYVPGPAIVELDRQIRLADPLLAAAAAPMEDLARSSGGAVLLCRLFRDRVLCIHHVAGRDAPVAISYERGRAMPLYRGATSRVILAHLPGRELARLARRDRVAIAAAGLPAGLAALRASLAPARAAGLLVSRGELDDDAIGFAVPLLDGARLLGSLSVVLAASGVREAAHPRMIAALRRALAAIEAGLESAREGGRAPWPRPDGRSA